MTDFATQLGKSPDYSEYFYKLEKMFPDLDIDFMVGFGSTMLRIHRLMVLTESYFQNVGTSKSRFLILARLLIADSPQGESISQIRLFYPISYAAMSGVLDTLEKDGMIERLSHPSDRRKVNIVITDAGREFMMNFIPSHIENLKAISACLSNEDMMAFSDTLKTLITGFGDFLSKDSDKTVKLK
jgi:DNA-binding MarR family transcriptional regulator